MNSIIIKKHLRENRHDIVPCDLIVAFNRKKVVPNFGLIQIKRETDIVIEDNSRRVEAGDSFLDIFKNHC